MSKRSIVLIITGLILILLAALLIRPARPRPQVTETPPTGWTIPGVASPTPQGTQTPSPSAQPYPAPSTSTPAAGAPTTAVTPTVTQTGRAFYAAPTGSAQGDGSQEHPWDLETALQGPSSIQPGDTLWLRGGLYSYRHLDYLYCLLEGAPDRPITVRAYPGERVTLDAALVIRKGWVTIWGLEVIDSNPDRTASYFRKDGVAAWAPHVLLVNNIVHDAGGFGFWWQAQDAEMYGNIIYNNGFTGSDRGHGHGIYTTNKDGIKRIADNILFNNFSGINVHAYSEKTYLNGFVFEGNVSFNGHFLVGGLVPASNVSLIDNMFYRGAVQLGYRVGVENSGLVLSGNLFHAQDEDSLSIQWWQDVRAANNIAWMGPLNGIVQSVLSDGHSYSLAKMDGIKTIVRPNIYEPGRGNIIIYNWGKQPTVKVDVSDLGLQPGDRYILHNAQNYFDETIQGVYQGQPIDVPMTGWSIAIPTGLAAPLQPATFPEFGVFVIERAAPVQ